jgi:hypothetical protein
VALVPLWPPPSQTVILSIFILLIASTWALTISSSFSISSRLAAACASPLHALDQALITQRLRFEQPAQTFGLGLILHQDAVGLTAGLAAGALGIGFGVDFLLGLVDFLLGNFFGLEQAMRVIVFGI